MPFGEPQKVEVLVLQKGVCNGYLLQTMS